MTYHVLIACVLLMWIVARRIPEWAKRTMKQREHDHQEWERRVRGKQQGHGAGPSAREDARG